MGFQDEHFSVRDIQQIRLTDGYRIIITTDVPCHLWMRWTTNKPWVHIVPVYRRGFQMHADTYFCFTAYTDNEQEEPGDTLIHTFIKTGWPSCETRYFYFTGKISGTPSVSTTAYLEKHFQAAGWTFLFTEPWTYYYIPPPAFQFLFTEPWTS